MKRFLWPREHGAYAQLAFPLLSGLALGGPTAAGLALGVATVSAFLAYEPVVVRAGGRGVRLQREHAVTARRQLIVLIPLALAAGMMGAWLAPPGGRRLIALPAALGACLALMLLARRVKTLPGEVVVAGTLAAMHLPIAASGAANGIQLWGPAGVWFSGFLLATLVVHAIKADLKGRDRWIRIAATVVAVAGLLGALSLIAIADLHILGVALLIPVLAAFGVSLAHVHPRQLKRVGWTLVAANLATLLVFTRL